MTGASPSDSNELRQVLAEVGGSMTGASPVTTISRRVASHAVASRRIVVTGLAPLKPTHSSIGVFGGMTGTSPVTPRLTAT